MSRGPLTPALSPRGRGSSTDAATSATLRRNVAKHGRATMTRITILKREELNAEQGRVYDEAKAANAPVGGPYYAYIRNPRMFTAAQEMGKAVGSFKLTGRERQIAVLTTARFWNARYPWGAQVRNSLAQASTRRRSTRSTPARRPTCPIRARRWRTAGEGAADQQRAQRGDLQGSRKAVRGGGSRRLGRRRRAVLDGELHRQRLRRHTDRGNAEARLRGRRHEAQHQSYSHDPYRQSAPAPDMLATMRAIAAGQPYDSAPMRRR